MGLDQYAYAKDKNGEDTQLADWRKHNRLQGWMEQLWESKGKPFDGELDESPMGDFNCVPVELTSSDLDDLEEAICSKELPETGGFFFGSDSYEWETEDGEDYFYKTTDLEFIENARSAIINGDKVFYSSWW